MRKGKVYKVTHSRKGQFTIKVIEQDKIWVTASMVDGTTTTMIPENQSAVGEEITVRKSFLTDIEEVK